MSELDKFTAQVNATAFLPPDERESELEKHRRKKLKPVRLPAWTRRIGTMNQAQLRVTLKLLDGDAVLVLVKGESYAVWGREDCCWVVRGMQPDDPEWVVSEDITACTCPRSRFQGEECKHLQAVRKMP